MERQTDAERLRSLPDDHDPAALDDKGRLRILVMTAIGAVVSNGGNSYVDCWMESWLREAHAMGCYDGPICGDIRAVKDYLNRQDDIWVEAHPGTCTSGPYLPKTADGFAGEDIEYRALNKDGRVLAVAATYKAAQALAPRAASILGFVPGTPTLA